MGGGGGGLVAKLCSTLCGPMDHSLLGSSIYGISHVRILEWVAISFFRRIFPAQGLNPHIQQCGWSPTLQADCLPLSHQGNQSCCLCAREHMEKEMATHSSILAWRILGTEDPGRLPSMGSHRVGHNWSDLAAAASEYTHHLGSLLSLMLLWLHLKLTHECQKIWNGWIYICWYVHSF